MDQRDEFSKWMSAVEEAIRNEGAPMQQVLSRPQCECGSWNCEICFPEVNSEIVTIDDMSQDSTGCPSCQGMGCPTCDGSEIDQGMQGMEEDGNDFIQKPKSGKGVKLGDIIQKTEVRPTSGQNSPMTYGNDNLDEEIPDGANPEDYGKAGRYLQQTFGNIDEQPDVGGDEDLSFEQDIMHKQEMADKIASIQDMGLSKDNKHYSREELMRYSSEEMKSCYDRVMGDVSESKPTMAKTQHHLDDIDDILNPRRADLPATVATTSDEISSTGKMSLPAASRADTQRRVGSITPSDTMRDLMNRISPMAGAGEAGVVPDQATDAVALRTAADVPAVISNAMKASGMQTPQWHNVNNLPGYNQQNVRGMGRQLFSMFTNTPLEQIQTIANVNGQGPNTDAEMRAVAGWLRSNAEDLGVVDVDHGMANPGYKPDVKEYRANGVRFHLVRDPMGQYIYAYPDSDAKLGGAPVGQGQINGGNMPRLRESVSLFEQMKWDEEIEEAFIEESSLSKLIGKQKGGQNLVRWMHRRHGLSNDADLQPAPFSERLLWKQFKANPDNFVIVTSENGVAGIKPDKKFIDNRIKEFAKKGKTYNPSGDSTLPYQVVAFTDDGQQVDPELLRAPPEDGEDYRDPRDPTVMRARMGKHSGKDMQNPYNVFNLLAEQIGALRTVYISGFENAHDGQQKGSVERDKMKTRADMKKGDTMQPGVAVQKIFDRIRPVLKTLANQAILQINKRAQRYIEGGNFEGAQKVAANGQKLKQLLVSLDTNNAVNVDTSYISRTKELSTAITKAIAQAAESPVDSDAYNEYAEAAAKGNASALRPILDGLRDQLVGL